MEQSCPRVGQFLFFFYYGIYTTVYEDGWIMDKRLTAGSRGSTVSWIIYYYLVWCKRKILFLGENLWSFTGQRTDCAGPAASTNYLYFYSKIFVCLAQAHMSSSVRPVIFASRLTQSWYYFKRSYFYLFFYSFSCPIFYPDIDKFLPLSFKRWTNKIIVITFALLKK